MNRCLCILALGAMLLLPAIALADAPAPADDKSSSGPGALARLSLSTISEVSTSTPSNKPGKAVKVKGDLHVNSAPAEEHPPDVGDESNLGSTPWMLGEPKDTCAMNDARDPSFLRMERVLPPAPQERALRLEVRHVHKATRSVMDTETIALDLVASSFGESVYAYRDATFVHLIWPYVTGLRPVHWRDAESELQAANCGHAHMLLAIEDANGPKSSAFAVAPISGFLQSKKHTPPREVRVSASLTRSTRDREPLVSVAFTYGEEDGTQAFMQLMTSEERFVPPRR